VVEGIGCSFLAKEYLIGAEGFADDAMAATDLAVNNCVAVGSHDGSNDRSETLN
jgi:hypothetical protein